MKLTDSTAAKVQSAAVSAIACATSALRHFHVYGSVTLSQALSGAIGLVKEGAGALTLSAANTHTGGTTVNGGELILSIASALTGSVTVNTGGKLTAGTHNTLNSISTLSINPGGILDLSGWAVGSPPATINLTDASIIGAGGYIGGGTCNLNGTNSWLTGSLDIRGRVTVLNATSGSTTTISSIINQTTGGSFTKNGVGTVILNGSAAFGTATFALSAGTLIITGAFQAGNFTTAFANNGLLVIENSSQTLGGIISGTGALTKNGSGTLTLSAVNTYSGATTLNAGTLIVTGNIANSDLVLTSGILSANTTAAVKKVDVKSLTVNGAATFACTVLSATAFTAGTNYDQINSAGAVTLNNTSATPLTIALYGTPTGWSNTGIYNYDIINAPSVAGFSANKLVPDFTNFGILAANRTGTWVFSNPSLGIVRMRYAGVAISSFTWNTGTGNWGVAANWVEGTVVSQNAYISFTGAGGTSTNTVAQATLTTLFDITFSSAAGAYILNSATGSSGAAGSTAMAVRGDVINNSANTQIIAFNYSILHNQIHSGDTTISGVISSTGGLIKDGTGTTLLLLGANTFTGGISVVNGTLSLGSTGLLGNGAYAGAISNGSALIFGSDSNQTLSGVISGVGALTKNGLGVLALSGANTHSGTITLNSGTLAINSTGALGTCALVINGGSLDNTSGSAKTLTTVNAQYWNSNFTFVGSAILTTSAAGSGTVSMNASRIVTVAANELAVGAAISGVGFSLTKNGNGALTLNGANTYSGGTILNAGLLNINTATAIGGGALTISGGNIGCTATANITLTSNNTQNWDADFSYTGGVRTLNLGTGSVTMSGHRQVNIVSGTLAIGGNVANAYSLTKTGTGTLALNGINTFSGGGLIVNAGTVSIGAQYGITTPIIINSGGTLIPSNQNVLNNCSSVTVNSGGTLTTTSAWLLRAFAGELVMNGGTLNLNSGGDFGAGTYTFTGTNTFNPGQITSGTSIFNVVSGTTTMTGGVISFNLIGPNVGLTKNGAGTLDFGTRVNTYGGTTTINAGSVIARATTAGVTATATFTPTSITVDFGGVAPKTGTVFKFFPGATSPSNLSLSLLNAGGAVGTYNFANSSLSVGTTPSTTGMQVWLDASVADTLYTATTGGTSVSADATAVARWEDISGNGRHLTQTASGNQPLLKTSVQNGRNVLRFDGTNDELNIASFPNTTNTTHIFAVFKLNGADFSSGQGAGRFIKSQFNSATTQYLMLGASSIAYGNSYGMGVGTISSNADYTILSIPFNNNASLFSITKPASGTTEAHRNGVLVGQETATAAAACTAQKLQVGGDISNGNGCMRGDMCEVIVYSSPLTAAERQAVETYLNNKWAIY